MPANPSEGVQAITSEASDASCEVLAMRLGDGGCRFGILLVQEIRGYQQPTRLAGAPARCWA